ncbi:DUF3644 domain-containing protein [Rhodococcus pyridinivorans]|uniref:DUF3644 domain-containing protein n=1 Tax=Rhodococcus TaxID=1827 RepID=UPI001C310C0A|nr:MULTISPECIES: DUF3644 domain-containing protein [Rhodococcus]MCT7294313.1 DUF3644 domain-containing protein [Rhodococcus sp. PAE-6]QXF84456.1 DUF3644 domain-containing protein [Rhodococcus pyridinivorans]
MAPRPHWWHVLQASKNEVRLAVDLYNRSGDARQLEAFIVHMSMGWLKLLQAHFEKAGRDVYIRDSRGRRIRHEDGDWKYKSLSTLMMEFFTPNDPRKANLDFFVGLRNRIEHRHEKNIAALVAGRTQAYLLNYETTLVELFGDDEAVATELRFPLFLSSITDDAAKAVKKVRSQVPRGVLEWVQDFDAGLSPDLAADQQFDFRIYLIPYKGPKTEADAVMTFVRPEELTEEQNAVMDQVRTIIREKQIPVADLGTLRPGQVVERVAAELSQPFTTHHHTQAWRYFGVRPPVGADDPTKTKADFCRYNQTFERYVYTESWVSYLIRKLSDPETYEAVMTWKP